MPAPPFSAIVTPSSTPAVTPIAFVQAIVLAYQR
ncbi:MAG: hypothetical protein JWP96_2658, partial [Polaromonas sp.]|nr:hypothetical protein [Polaromonas sp.]